MSVFCTVCFQVTFMQLNNEVLIRLHHSIALYLTIHLKEVLSMKTQREKIAFSFSHPTVMLPLTFLPPAVAPLSFLFLTTAVPT